MVARTEIEFLPVAMDTQRKVFIGLTDEQRQGVIELLNRDLADTFLLLIKTKKAQWDVWGPEFKVLQRLWDEQYQILMRNIDSYAERTRILGGYPASTAGEFLHISSVQEIPDTKLTTLQTVFNLLKDHEQLVRSLREHIDLCSERFHDRGTADFLIGLLQHHEQMAWTLRSFTMRSFIEQERSALEMDEIFRHLTQNHTPPKPDRTSGLGS
jgi:starvation-inducible DNA-binding protein